MKIIGHRGARGLAPANTIAGLHKAIEHGVDEVEFDLRVTKDHVIVLHHDKKIVDPNGQKHKISDFTYAELKAHKPDLPTLNELLDEWDSVIPVCLELKGGEPTAPVIKVIKDSSKTKNLLLGSKSQKTLRELHEALPDIPKVVIEPWSGIRATRRAKQLGTRRISMNKISLWWGFIRTLNRRGYQLSAYTLNDPIKAQRWAKHGLYGVITDYPDRFLK